MMKLLKKTGWSTDTATTYLGIGSIVFAVLNKNNVYPVVTGTLAAISGGAYAFLTNKPDPRGSIQ